MRRDVRKALLKAASEGRTVTYGYLMKKFGLTRGRGVRGVVTIIGEVDDYEYKRGGPGFGAIVVRKDTGLPGGGYFCSDGLPTGLRRPRGQATNPKLSKLEKNHIALEQRTIWRYYGRRL